MIWVIILALIALLVWYALAGRAWLKGKSWAQGFFAWIEPVERGLYKKSETILMGRLLWVGGFLVTFYDSLATFVTSLDMTPITTRIFDAAHIPPDLRGLSLSAFVTLIGLMINSLRKRITQPLEVVAAPAAVQAQVADVIATANAAKDQAVAAVKDAA